MIKDFTPNALYIHTFLNMISVGDSGMCWKWDGIGHVVVKGDMCPSHIPVREPGQTYRLRVDALIIKSFCNYDPFYIVEERFFRDLDQELKERRHFVFGL